tara:strand:+ start:33 stop:875 length:843 start_codon:yes stop_codon:yes gene_type:complete
MLTLTIKGEYMKTTHTHKGHCQACGRLHAVDNETNKLAQHGYTVDWGFFNGVCNGADHLPIQIDKSLAEKTIVNATKYVAKKTDLLNNIDSWLPSKVSAIYHKVDGVWGLTTRRYSTFGQYDPKNFADEENYKMTYINIEDLKEFLVANESDLRFGIQFEDIVNSYRATQKRELANEILNGQALIDSLEDLIERLHGKDLIDSQMTQKIVAELTQKATGPLLKREEGTGRLGYQNSAETMVGDHVLMVKVMRNRTWKGYGAYTYLDGKKIGAKKLEEVLG